MLRLNDVSIGRGTRILYEHATAVADMSDRVGLVGENGCGKSSLFAAILGELSPEAGSIDAPPQDRIAHVAQTVVETDEKALDYVLSGHAPLVAAKAELAAAQTSVDAMREAAALAQLAEVNEGAVRAQAQTILCGLGFLPADDVRDVKSFSGGWRNRLALARALMRPADLLLLDEPTNHLDMDSLIWLEAWLKRVRCTVVIISHDREFLDRATNVTWAIENGKLERYGGNYSFYEMQRLEKIKLQDAAAKAYEREASHLSAFIERFRYKATKARQAQSRIKMLEKLKAVEPVKARREWRFEFPVPERTPEHLIDIEHLKLGYGDHVVLNDVMLTIRAGDRVGVLGVNGAGKSTLIKAIADTLTPMAGTRIDVQPPSAFFTGWRQADAAMRVFCLRALVSYVCCMGYNAADIIATTAVFVRMGHEMQSMDTDEVRVGLSLKNQPSAVVAGVVLPTLPEEHEQNQTFAAEVLHDAGINEIVSLPQTFPMEWCEDCGSPLYANSEGYVRHIETPAGLDEKTFAPTLN